MLNKNKQPHKLTIKQDRFIDYYIETGNGMQSAIRAGYTPKNAHVTANQILNKVYIQEEIKRRTQPTKDLHIATGEEVMNFFTRAMNGEIKDQFGLDATLGDRIRAGQELAKRTVDIDNKMAGKEDSTVHIKLDWD